MKPINPIYLPAFLLLVACGSGSNNRDTSTADKESLEEVVLFDGKSLDGWKNYGGGKFFVEDGAIVGEAALKLPNSFLATEAMYEDFDLQVEVLIDPLLNSGVQIRSNTYEKETKTIRWGGRFKDDGTKDVAERT